MNFNKFQQIFMIVLFSLGLTILPLVAQAASLSINILPAKVFVTIEKGESAEQEISIGNPNIFPIDILVEIENFIPGVMPGDIEFVVPVDGRESLADWIETSRSFSLEANERKDIIFKVQVPEQVSSGGHYAVIFFRATPKTAEIAGPLQISSRVGSLIMLTVPGDINQKARISKFSAPKIVSSGPVDFEILVENKGDSHFKTEGNILIKNWLGKEIGVAGVEQRIVLPQGSQSLKAGWPAGFPLGLYRAELTILVGAAPPLVAEVSFFAFPWKQPFIFFIILIIIILISYFKGFRFIKR